MTRFRLLLTVPLVILILEVGCGPKNPNAPATVSGTVTYKGKKLPGGTVTFHPQSGAGGAYTAELRDGAYVVKDAPTGEALVAVETESRNPENLKKQTTYGGERGKAAAKMNAGRRPPSTVDPATYYVKIPANYSDPKKSGLKKELKPGKQTFDIELKD